MADESRVVTAVGVAVHSTAGRVVGARLNAAMSQAVLACNAAGISTDEKNSALLRACMMAAKDAVKQAALAGDVTSDDARVRAAVADTLAQHGRDHA